MFVRMFPRSCEQWVLLANASFCRLVFVCMTNILLITSLISLLSNSLTEVRRTGASSTVNSGALWLCD